MSSAKRRRPAVREAAVREASVRAPKPVGRVAAMAVAALAGVFAYRQLDDFDTWWHLAAGRFIVAHRAIPATDVLSHTVRDHRWINLEWAFEVVAYALHAAGGSVALALAALAAFTLAVVLVVRLLRRAIGDAGAALLGLVVVIIVQDRFAARPELLSFPLLAAVLTVLDAARRGGRPAPWLLVPLMIVWVNVHALFVVGVFAIVCGIASAPSRRLAAWGAAAIAATVVNPFGLDGVLLPLRLFALIDKSSPALHAIAEFRSPFAPDAAGLPVAAFKALLVVGGAALIAATVARLRRPDPGEGRWRGVDPGDLALFAGLAALAFVARRNAALFAIGASPVIARAFAALAARAPEGARAAMRRTAPVAAGATIAACLGLAPLVVTGWYYRWDRQPREFGGGVLEGSFPIRAAEFARAARLPGKLYNDLAAGGYLAWDDPIGDGVYVDGRLEVYDDAFITAYVTAMYEPALWNAEADRRGIGTVILFHRWENRRLLAESLLGNPAWSLVYADEVAVIFVRVAGNEEAIARADALQASFNARTRAWLERPAPRWRYPAGRVEGTRAFARLLATMGDAEGSAEQFVRLIGLGIEASEEADIRLRLAKLYRNTGRDGASRRELDRVLEIAPGNAEARALRGR